MSRIDPAGVTGPAAREPAPPSPRSDTAQRFDEALRRDSGSDAEGRGGRQGRDEGDGRRESAERSEYDLTLSGREFPASVWRLVRESIARGLPESPAGGGLLEGLLHDIADGVHAGRHLPGDRWRLLVRLRAELLPATEVDISCADERLAVVLRTADEDAYRTLVEALPRLNESLRDRAIASDDAVVFLVTPKDLQ